MLRKSRDNRNNPLLNAWPLGLIWLVLLIHFSPELFTRRSFCFIDFSRHYYPLKAYAVSCLRSGLLPLWNPLIYCGFPQLGDIQVNIFYPLNLILLIGDFTHRLELYVFIHQLIAAATAYYLGRSLNSSRGASTVLAAAYSLSGYLLLSHHVTPALCSLAYLPLVIACFYSYFNRGGWRHLLGGVAALSLQITAGYPITVYQTMLGLAVLYLVMLATSARPRQPGHQSLTPGSQTTPPQKLIPRGVFAALAVFAASAVAAVVLLPFIELVSISDRIAGTTLKEMVPKSVSWQALKIFFSPAYFGVPTSPFYHGPVRPVWLGIYYCGPVLLWLALCAALDRRSQTRNAFFALGITGLVLMLADQIPFSNQLLTHLIPGLSAINHKGTFFSLLLVSLSVLSALGFDAVNARAARKNLLPLFLAVLLMIPFFTIPNPVQRPELIVSSLLYAFFICLLAAGLLLKNKFPAGWFRPFLIALVILDLASAGWMNYRQDVNESFYPQTRPNPLPTFNGRTHHPRQVIEIHKRIWAPSYEEFLYSTKKLALPNLNLLTDTYCVAGYGSLNPYPYRDIFHRVEQKEYRFAAVSKAYRLLKNGDCLLVNIRKDGTPLMMAEYFKSKTFCRDNGLSFHRQLPGKMEITLEQAGEIVVKECWHPGWRLYRIGESATLLRQGYGGQAGRIGEHPITQLSGLMRFKVESGGSYLLRFEPFSFKLGLFISLLSLAALSALLTAYRLMRYTH